MDDALPTVGMTIRFLALCDLYGSHRAAVGMVAEGRRAGAPGLPGDDDWTQWNATQMRAAVEYLESRRDAGPRAEHPVPEVVVASHQLPEQQALGGLAHPLDRQRLDIAHAAQERAPRLPRGRPRNAGDRTDRAALALVRQHQRTTRVEPLQELPALPGLQLPIRAPPPQQLAHGARQLHPAQARTVPHNLADQRHLLHAEGTSREPRRRHGHRRGVSLPTTPYQNAARMSSGGAPEGDRPKRSDAVVRPGWLPEKRRVGALSPRKAHRRGSSASTNAYE